MSVPERLERSSARRYFVTGWGNINVIIRWTNCNEFTVTMMCAQVHSAYLCDSLREHARTMGSPSGLKTARTLVEPAQSSSTPTSSPKVSSQHSTVMTKIQNIYRTEFSLCLPREVNQPWERAQRQKAWQTATERCVPLTERNGNCQTKEATIQKAISKRAHWTEEVGQLLTTGEALQFHSKSLQTIPLLVLSSVTSFISDSCISTMLHRAWLQYWFGSL